MFALRTRLILKADNLLNRMDTTPAFGWAVGLFLMAASLVPKFSHNLSGDSNVYIYLAGRLLDGERYYTDFFEYNTPFAIGAYTLPLMLGRLFGITDMLAAKLFVLALSLASIGMVHLIVSRSREWSVPLRYNALIIALFYTLNFRNDFYANELATKSIIFICCILPYIFSLQLRLEKSFLPQWMEVAIGVAVGFALLLKPHYLLFPIVMEAWLAWHLHSLKSLVRKSNLIAAAVVIIGYGALLPLFFPGYLRGLPYFFIYYPTEDIGHSDRVDIGLTSLLYCLPLLVWFVAMRHPLKQLASHDIFLAVVAAALIVLNVEALLSVDQKSLLAFFVSLALLYSVLVFLRAPHAVKAAIQKTEKIPAVFAIILASIGVFGMTTLLPAFIPHKLARENVAKAMVEYVHRYAPHDPVYTISDNTEHFVPALLEVERRPYPVFHTMRMLLTMSRHTAMESDKSRKDAEDYFYRSLLHFFETTPPKLVFVSRINSSKEFGRCWPVPLEIVLSTSPEFQMIWNSHYRKIGAIIVNEEPAWPEDKPVRKSMLDFGGGRQEATFLPENRMETWLDVYIWDD